MLFTSKAGLEQRIKDQDRKISDLQDSLFELENWMDARNGNVADLENKLEEMEKRIARQEVWTIQTMFGVSKLERDIELLKEFANLQLDYNELDWVEDGSDGSDDDEPILPN